MQMQLIAERADIPRKLGHHAADLARSEMMHQDLENRTRGIFTGRLTMNGPRPKRLSSRLPQTLSMRDLWRLMFGGRKAA